MNIPILKNISYLIEPKNIRDFSMPSEAYITTEDSEGADIFYFSMITPRCLKKISKSEYPLYLRAVFVVNGTSMQENIDFVANEIKKLLLDCSRDTWEETALAINYYLKWEYYDPTKGICDFYKATRNLV